MSKNLIKKTSAVSRNTLLDWESRSLTLDWLSVAFEQWYSQYVSQLNASNNGPVVASFDAFQWYR